MSDIMIQRAAYLQTKAACAIVEAIAMMVERRREGLDTHGGQRVRDLIDKYGIGENTVLSYLRE